MRLLSWFTHFNHSHLISRIQQSAILYINENISGKAFCPSCVSPIKIIFPFSSMYFHGFCSKQKIHQLMYRLHDASCPHPLAHLDLSPKATWPRAHTQSRWGYQPKGSTTRLILPSQSMWLSLLAQLHQLSFERKRVRQSLWFWLCSF